MIYGMLRNPRKRGTIGSVMKLYPDVCPMCGKRAWKTAMADDIVKRGGRTLCTKCAMSTAWDEG